MQEKGSDAVFVHGKSSSRGNDAKEDKYEKRLFSEDRPPRFSKVRKSWGSVTFRCGSESADPYL